MYDRDGCRMDDEIFWNGWPLMILWQEGYNRTRTRFSHCLNAKIGFVYFWSVNLPLEGQCLKTG